MKGIVLILAAMMVGCAEHQTLEELELAALESGDWSAVEKREQLMEKRRARRGMNCGSGRVLVCEHRGAGKHCFCTSDDGVRAILDSF